MVRYMVKLQLLSVMDWNTLIMEKPTLSKPAISFAVLVGNSCRDGGMQTAASEGEATVHLDHQRDRALSCAVTNAIQCDEVTDAGYYVVLQWLAAALLLQAALHWHSMCSHLAR
jgi:hypothetical protein